jgi:hypothetical protein
MIPNSFKDEFLKQAAGLGFLPSLAKVVGEHVPSALTSIGGSLRAAGLANVTKARTVGALAGAAGGAVTGASIGSPENKDKNRLIGAVAGGVLGGMGGAKLAPKVQTFGSAAGPALKALGQEMTAGKVTGKNVLDYMATKWAPKVQPLEGQLKNLGVPTPTANVGVPGFQKSVKSLGEVNYPVGKPLGHIGEMAQNAQVITQRPGIVGKGSGLAEVLKGNWREHQFNIKDIAGTEHMFQRSNVGKIVSPSLQSGLGMGAADFLMGGKDEQGNKKPIGKRLLSSGGTALAWGTAPKLMAGKVLAYDVPKTLIGMKKPKELATDIPPQ